MLDMIATGLGWLESQRQAHMSTSVAYEDSAHYRHEGIAATWARTDFTVEDREGVQTGGTITDFILPADALDGRDPKPGDTIEAGGTVYEVAAFGQDANGWRWVSPHREALRVHAVEVRDI